MVDTLPPPPAINSPEYTAAYNEVKDFGDSNSAVRTPEQTEIGMFWAYDRPSMGPPPVLFIRNLEEIAAQAGNTPAENARLFAMASVAQADAAIASWDAKFSTTSGGRSAPSTRRSASTAQAGHADGDPNTADDTDVAAARRRRQQPGGTADDFTPPFPAWTSGHATMGGAIFKSLELFYGTNLVDEQSTASSATTHVRAPLRECGADRGDSREFSTFTQDGPLALGTEDSPEGENGMSRVYLGIHWIFDQTDGITLGNAIAEYVRDELLPGGARAGHPFAGRFCTVGGSTPQACSRRGVPLRLGSVTHASEKERKFVRVLLLGVSSFSRLSAFARNLSSVMRPRPAAWLIQAASASNDSVSATMHRQFVRAEVRKQEATACPPRRLFIFIATATTAFGRGQSDQRARRPRQRAGHERRGADGSRQSLRGAGVLQELQGRGHQSGAWLRGLRRPGEPFRQERRAIAARRPTYHLTLLGRTRWGFVIW